MPLRQSSGGSNRSKKKSTRKPGFHLLRDIEPLESRRLLTTLHGGDSFEYTDINGAIDRITLTGNITAEIIGSSVDRNTNNITLIDLPGQLYNATTGAGGTALNGGLTTPQGASVIGPITIVDPFDANGNVSGTISGLASDPAGNLYGVNVVIPQNTTAGTGTGNLLQIVKLDSRNASGVVVAEVHTQAIIAASAFSAFAGTSPQIMGATAAAFSPVNGLLYFVATGGTNSTPVLFTIDVNSSDIAGSLKAIPGTFRSNGANATDVGAITFDQTGVGQARLIAALNIGANTQLATINPNNSDAWNNQIPLATGGNPIVGLTIRGDNPNAVDNIFFALAGVATAGGGGGGGVAAGGTPITAGSEIQITVTPGTNIANVVSFGPLSTSVITPGTPNATQTTESSPGDLTFDPTLVDFFTGQVGAMVGTDLTTHDLFIVSPINRTPTTTLFNIYVSQSDSTGTISVATTPPLTTTPRPMLPFTGSIGSVRIRNTVNEVTAPGNSGAVLLGAKTIQLTGNANTGDIPILSGSLDAAHGVLPGGIGTQVEAGLVVAPGQNLGKFLFGGTIMGQVLIHGSIDQFYAGWLITGDSSSGLFSNNSPNGFPGPPPLNFLVDGDIQNLYVLGPIGTDPGYGANQSSDANDFTGGTTATGSLTNPAYYTGFQMFVHGTIGQIKAGGSIIGSIHAGNSAFPGVARLSTQVEAEYRRGAPVSGLPFPFGLSAWDDGFMGGNAFFNNDTFTTEEFVGSIPTTAGGTNSQVSLQGALQSARGPNDYVDYYGLAMLAGQNITVNLSSTSGGIGGGGVGQLTTSLILGIFDPDGRLVATDYNDVLPSETLKHQFRFTSTLPGVYRFAVAQATNTTFAAAPTGPRSTSNFNYTVNIQNVGDLGIGAIVTYSSFLAQDLRGGGGSINVDQGDLGAVETSGTTIDGLLNVPNGNLRSVDAGSIGVGFDGPAGTRFGQTGVAQSGGLTVPAGGAPTPPGTFNTTIFTGYSLNVPRGSVGLINAFGGPSNNMLQLEMNPVGGDVQTVSVVGQFVGDVVANGAIGTIRAGDMNQQDIAGSQFHTRFIANADRIGEDGTIDLIDVLGQFGTPQDGGPIISTGPGGNVRYMKIGGAIFLDPNFGGGLDTPTNYNNGVVATIIDDSGALVNITPEGDVPNPLFVAGTLDPTNPAFPQFLPASVSVTTYPIEGSGGAAIVDVTSTGSVTINTTGDVAGQAAEIGRIQINGPGTPIANNTTISPQASGVGVGTFRRPKQTAVQPAAPTPQTIVPGGTTGGSNSGTTSGTGSSGTGTLFAAAAPTVAGPGGAPGIAAGTGSPLFVHIFGPGALDVLNIVVTNGGSTFGSATEITNTTGGELVSIIAQSVGRIFSTGSVGVAKQHTAAATQPFQVLTAAAALDASEARPVDADLTVGHFFGSLYPTLGLRVGVEIMAGYLLSIEAPVIGNVLVNGSIGQVIADGNQVGQGIVGAVVAYNLSLPANLNRYGIPSSANPGNIGVVNIGGGIAPTGAGAVGFAGLYADGRIGTVTGSDADIRGNIISTQGIDFISLHNGSIIDADIASAGGGGGQQQTWMELIRPHSILNANTPLDRPTLDIGSIVVNGNGGIIGTFIAADHLGTIAVNGGYGIFNSFIEAPNGGTIDTIRADGYGIRNTAINPGITLGQLVVTQNGQDIPTSNFGPSVRQSESLAWDPYFGFQPGFLTDIDTYLGTTAASPTNPGRTDGGVLEDVAVATSRDIRTIRAFRVRDTALPGVLGGLGSGAVANDTYQNWGIRLLTPKFASNLNVGGTIHSLTVTDTVDGWNIVSGKVDNMLFGSDVNGFTMQLSGKINKLNINGNLANGSIIYAKGNNGNIGTIKVRGNVDGTIKAERKIGTLFIGGNLSGTVDAPNIQKVQAGNLNTGTLVIDGNLQNLISLGDLGNPGQVILVHGSVGTVKAGGNLNASMTVEGNLKTLKIAKSIISGVTLSVAGTLSSLQVGGDLQANSTIQAHAIKVKKIKGQTLGTILVG